MGFSLEGVLNPVALFLPGVLKNELIDRLYRVVMANTGRNRNLKISKALLKSQAHQGTSLFTSAATNQRGFPNGGQEKLRSDFQNTRRDREAVKVGVVQMEKVSDQMGQGRSV